MRAIRKTPQASRVVLTAVPLTACFAPLTDSRVGHARNLLLEPNGQDHSDGGRTHIGGGQLQDVARKQRRLRGVLADVS